MHGPSQPWAPLSGVAQPSSGVLASRCGVPGGSGGVCRDTEPASQAAPEPSEGNSQSVLQGVRAAGPGLAVGAAALGPQSGAGLPAESRAPLWGHRRLRGSGFCPCRPGSAACFRAAPFTLPHSFQDPSSLWSS